MEVPVSRMGGRPVGRGPESQGQVLGEGARETVNGQLTKDLTGRGFYCKNPGKWLEGFM